MDRTDRLGWRARWVLGLAEEMAEWHGTDTRAEHVLLALLHLGNTSALRLLQILGIDTRELGATVTRILSGNRTTDDRAATCLPLDEFVSGAAAEALREGRLRIATHHLLIAVTRGLDSDMSEALGAYGVTVERMRTSVDMLFYRDSDPDREWEIASEPARRPGVVEEAERVATGISPALGAALSPAVQRALMTAWVAASRESTLPISAARVVGVLLATESPLAATLEREGIDLRSLRMVIARVVASEAM